MRSLTCGSGGDVNAAWGSKYGVDSAGGSAGNVDTTWGFRDGVEGAC